MTECRQTRERPIIIHSGFLSRDSQAILVSPSIFSDGLEVRRLLAVLNGVVVQDKFVQGEADRAAQAPELLRVGSQLGRQALLTHQDDGQARPAGRNLQKVSAFPSRCRQPSRGAPAGTVRIPPLYAARLQVL